MKENEKTHEKTHWLSNQNKNYLGHFDLPSGQDQILTIHTAQWEAVENPRTKVKQEKRVIRFVENYPWVKPFICNETNAKTIYTISKKAYMEDCGGLKIKLGIDKTKMKGEEVDCIRIRNVNVNDHKITLEQVQKVKDLCNQKNTPIEKILNAYKIGTLEDLSSAKFDQVIKTLSNKPDAVKEEVANANN